MAGKAFYIQGTSNAAQGASTSKTCVEVIGTTARLLFIQRMRISQDTHKTSEQYEFPLSRMTTTGTGTGFTPLLKEPGAGAIAGTAKVADSVEPTMTASSLLQNARWNSLTGKDIVLPMGQEFYVAPSASAGVAFTSTTPASTTSMSPVIEVEMTELG